MCLGVPGQVVELRSNREAIVDFWGVRKPVRLENLKPVVVPGDYVIEHAGFAVRVIPPADVADTLALYEVLLSEAGEDPIARDVVDALDCIEVELEAPAFR
ncbi:MAG: HypC/HybG/HupF family hydrogenase formation chaperone [Thermoanaerobaculia bacterium]